LFLFSGGLIRLDCCSESFAVFGRLYHILQK